MLYFYFVMMDINPLYTTHEYFMRQALKEAAEAFDKDEVPIGAVVVVNNKTPGFQTELMLGICFFICR